MPWSASQAKAILKPSLKPEYVAAFSSLSWIISFLQMP